MTKKVSVLLDDAEMGGDKLRAGEAIAEHSSVEFNNKKPTSPKFKALFKAP